MNLLVESPFHAAELFLKGAIGEGLTVEFKKSREKVTSDVYQSICAFLNRNGGQVFLGVEDNGAITGIKEDAIEQMKKDLPWRPFCFLETMTLF